MTQKDLEEIALGLAGGVVLVILALVVGLLTGGHS